MKITDLQKAIIRAIGKAGIRKREIIIKHNGKVYNSETLPSSINSLKKKRFVVETAKKPGMEVYKLTDLGKQVLQGLS